MVDILISFLTFVLIIISLFLVLVILMQRANNNAGMGSAFGGGVTESAFGTETTNVLVKATKWASMAFFIIALVLYLLFMSREGSHSTVDDSSVPAIPVVEESVTEPDAAAPVESPPPVDISDEVEDEVVVPAEEAVDQTVPETEPTPAP